MGVLLHTQCITCNRSGAAYEDSNFIFECNSCKKYLNDKEIKRSTQQSLWVRFLYWWVK